MPGRCFCYQCSTFLTPDLREARPPEDVSDLELQLLLEEHINAQDAVRKTLRGRIFQVLMVVTWLFLFLSVFALLHKAWVERGLLLLLATGVLFLMSMAVSPPTPTVVLGPQQQELLMARYVVPPVLRELLGPSVTYDPAGVLPKKRLPSASFSLDSYTGYEGGQLARGTYRGVPVELGYAYLTDKRHLGHSNKNVDIFKGYCLSARTTRTVPSEIVLTEKFPGVLNTPEEPEAEYLEEIFKLSSRKPQALGCLTPDLRCRLVEAFTHCPGDMGVVWKPNSEIQIAAGQFDQPLEELTLEELKALYHKRLSLPLRILDCFLEN